MNREQRRKYYKEHKKNLLQISWWEWNSKQEKQQPIVNLVPTFKMPREEK